VLESPRAIVQDPRARLVALFVQQEGKVDEGFAVNGIEVERFR
jgi:hypothetical protein